MSNLILAGLSGTVLTLVILFLYSRLAFWRGRHNEVNKAYVDMVDRAILAERRRAEIEVELSYLKNTINTIASREVIAVLTEQQVQNILEALQQLVLAAAQNPKLPN